MSDDHDWTIVDATPTNDSALSGLVTLVCERCLAVKTADGPTADVDDAAAAEPSKNGTRVEANVDRSLYEFQTADARDRDGAPQPDAADAGEAARDTDADTNTETDTDVDADDQTPDADEHIAAFPSRSEIVVSSPSDDTTERLSQVAHVTDTDESGDARVYRIDREDVWTAAVDDADELLDTLRAVVGDSLTSGWASRLEQWYRDAHRYRLETDDGHTYVVADDPADLTALHDGLENNDHYTRVDDEHNRLRLRNGAEADVKETLYDDGYPVVDERRLDDGADLDVELRDEITLRDYQREWINHFDARGAGVFVGPSGSGKTIAALGAMSAIGGETLILVPSRELAGQWQAELLEKTTLERKQVGQYHGGQKRVRPVTIATYDTAAMSRHRELFNEQSWGLVIADECHHAVADTWKRFRQIQSVARLGLSATPVRESGDAKEIFTLIGPPVGSNWGRLFRDDWVSQPTVEVVEVPWGSETDRRRWGESSGKKKQIEAARNPKKREVIQRLLSEHNGQKTLIYVDWIRQGRELSEHLSVPFLYGETGHDRRDELYQQFRDGRLDALIVSRVGDEGIDLPDAEVVILASTMGSSRSQTGQRVGRVMRPGTNATGYVLVTRGTAEADWGRESTQYLAEKGVSVSTSEWEAES